LSPRLTARARLGTHAFWTVLSLKTRKEYAPMVKALEFELRSARFSRSRRRWGAMVREAKGMLERVGF
jgi:hypothetical protein